MSDERILPCPRCEGRGKKVEWVVERKVAMLAFLYVRKDILCHNCAGNGKVSERAAKKWQVKSGK